MQFQVKICQKTGLFKERLFNIATVKYKYQHKHLEWRYSNENEKGFGMRYDYCYGSRPRCTRNG